MKCCKWPTTSNGKKMTRINKVKTIFCFAGLIYFVLGSSCFSAATAVSQNDVVDIEIHETIQIEKENINLGDMALITGEDLQLVEKLKNIFLGKSPLPGKSKAISSNYINVRLKQNDVDFSHIRIQSPKETQVIRTFKRVSKDEIEKLVRAELPNLLPYEEDQIHIKSIVISDDVVLPAGEFTYTVMLPKNTDFMGQIPLSVSFYINGDYQKRVFATLDVESITSVIVARRPLKRGHTIADIDIRSMQMDLTDLPSNCIIKPDDVLGKKLIRSIDADTVLRTDLIVAPPTIARKNIVLMVAQTKEFKITAIGESVGKGNKGERIKVMNLESHKEVYARVIDSNTVEVDF
jgi:flagellar basal body P-ring formation protein FlgA